MVSPNFKLKDLGKSDLSHVEINDVSDRLNLGYGRRFSLKIGDDESKGLVFKKVLKKVKKLAHHIEGPDELAKLENLQGFVTKLKIANTAADVTYSKRSHWYKFRTWFHRLLDSGSHSDRLDKLEKNIQERIDEYHENESRFIKAIKNGDSRVINECIAADIDLNFRDVDGNSPLIQAINDGWSGPCCVIPFT